MIFTSLVIYLDRNYVCICGWPILESVAYHDPAVYSCDGHRREVRVCPCWGAR